MTVRTIADITPNGAAVPLSTDLNARAIYIVMTATGSTIRTGDSNVGSGRGALLPTGVLTTPYPRQDNEQQPYQLAHVYVYGASGADKVSITYGT